MTTDTQGPRRAPDITLGHGFAPAPFAPGRFASAIRRTLHGTHALQVIAEHSTSSLVLELAPHGVATACRGWHYRLRNDGPEVHTEERYREQQGYRGRYTVVDGVAEVVLARDDTVCAHLFEGTLDLVRAPSLELRCVLATPPGESAVSEPVLLCQPAVPWPAELEPYVMDQFSPPGWFALGAGNGLLVWISGRPPSAHAGDEPTTKVAVADELVDHDAWQRFF